MLGKQGWRLCINAESLVSRIYKARYFVIGNFLNAKLGNNLSYVWRSVLMKSQALIKQGAKWLVATGEKFKFVINCGLRMQVIIMSPSELKCCNRIKCHLYSVLIVELRTWILLKIFSMK